MVLKSNEQRSGNGHLLVIRQVSPRGHRSLVKQIAARLNDVANKVTEVGLVLFAILGSFNSDLHLPRQRFDDVRRGIDVPSVEGVYVVSDPGHFLTDFQDWDVDYQPFLQALDPRGLAFTEIWGTARPERCPSSSHTFPRCISA